jgi:hypothetical protein
MVEGYAQPGQFLFGLVLSFLSGAIFDAATVTTASGHTEGRQTMFGIPKTDLERIMSHYGLTEAEALELMSRYPIEDILPERGSGLITMPIEVYG